MSDELESAKETIDVIWGLCERLAQHMRDAVNFIAEGNPSNARKELNEAIDWWDEISGGVDT